MSNTNTTSPTSADFAELTTRTEERAETLYQDLSELEAFVERLAQRNADGESAAIAMALRISRSHTYQAWRLLRMLSGELVGLPMAGRLVESTKLATPVCCPAWSLAAAYWTWMRSPEGDDLLAQPSVMGSDGMALPLAYCPFCSAQAPSRMPADQLGKSSFAEPTGVVARISAISRSLHVPEATVEDDDEDTVEVPDA